MVGGGISTCSGTNGSFYWFMVTALKPYMLRWAGVVGGSISTCCGTNGGFYRVLFDWIVRTFPLPEGGPQHAMHNGATGGVQSQYMTSCLKWHMPENVDMVIVRCHPSAPLHALGHRP